MLCTAANTLYSMQSCILQDIRCDPGSCITNPACSVLLIGFSLQLLVLGQLKSSLALRLEVLDALAATQRLQQQPRQQRATYIKALELCSQAAGGPQAAVAATWLPRLHLAAAELDAAAVEVVAARGHAQAAGQAALRGGQPQAQVRWL